MELGPNDQFSLLPNDVIFEVRFRFKDTTTASPEAASVAQAVDNDPSGETGSVVSKTSSHSVGDFTKSAVATAGADQAPTVGNVKSETSVGSFGRTRKLPNWLLSLPGDKEPKPSATVQSLSATASSKTNGGSYTATCETVAFLKHFNMPVLFLPFSFQKKEV